MIPSSTSTIAGCATRPPSKRPIWERCLDYSVGVIGLLLLLPLIFTVVLIIKSTSKGPAVFKQRRIGYRGKPFMIYKFRTMFINAETSGHEQHSVNLIKTNQPLTKMDKRGDSRLVPLGRFLRASGIDELPQLVNILKGEMSLVGPRPCLPSEFDAFSKSERLRFDTMPGITGLWQVSGKNNLTFKEMIERDNEYTLRKSLSLYLEIALKTPFVLIRQIMDSRKPSVITRLTNSGEPVESRQKFAS